MSSQNQTFTSVHELYKHKRPVGPTAMASIFCVPCKYDFSLTWPEVPGKGTGNVGPHKTYRCGVTQYTYGELTDRQADTHTNHCCACALRVNRNLATECLA